MMKIHENEILSQLEQPHLKEVLFHEVMEHYQKNIYFFVRRMVGSHQDADDITQDTFILVWRNLHQFKGQSQISTWIHRIAYREALRWIKKNTPRQHHSFIDSSFQGPHQQMTEEDMVLWLDQGVSQLPEKQRAVFIFKYYENKTYEEMSEITGTSIGALKASFHHAAAKIEKYLQSKIMIP